MLTIHAYGCISQLANQRGEAGGVAGCRKGRLLAVGYLFILCRRLIGANYNPIFIILD